MASKRKYRGIDRLSTRDKVVVSLMVVVPTLIVLWLVWLPAIGSVLLSFTNWDGIGPLSGIKSVGLQNYRDIATIYPPFWPAIQHNLIWLAVMFLVATPLGMLFAVLVDRGVAGTRFYQTSIYLPVVLSLALIGFIWRLIYSRDQGLINAITGGTTDWYGDPNVNLWAALVAASLAPRGLHHAALPGRPQGCRPVAARGGQDRRCQRVADVLQGRLPGDAADQHHRPRRHLHRVAACLRPRVGHQQGPQRARA